MTAKVHLQYVTKLTGARVLILGGTSGIGFAVASAALEHGASVVISGSQPTKLATALSRLKATYSTPTYQDRISGYTCDLGTPETLEANLSTLFTQATTQGRGSKISDVDANAEPKTQIDHVVFTAGDALTITPVKDITVDYVHRAGHVRFLGPLMLAKVAPSFMPGSNVSSITLTSGSQSAKPTAGWTVMAAYGSAIEGMMRGLAIDLAPIRVNVVSPGAVHTELFADIPQERLNGVLEKMQAETLVGEVGKPEDVAEAYLYSMKDKFCTGNLLETNGGRLLK